MKSGVKPGAWLSAVVPSAVTFELKHKMAAQNEDIAAAVVSKDVDVAMAVDVKDEGIGDGAVCCDVEDVGGESVINGCKSRGVGKEVTLHSASVQEPSVRFIVKDLTGGQKSKCTCSLPHSTAVTDLYSAVAKEAGRTG